MEPVPTISAEGVPAVRRVLAVHQGLDGAHALPGTVARGFRADINALRAASIAMVVGFHFDIIGFAGGFVGVDVFFLVSGFLMTQIIMNSALDRASILHFIALRLVRIFPALAVMVMGCVVLSWFLIDPLQQSRLAAEAVYAVSFVANLFYLNHTNYFEPASTQRWLLHTWSLAVEWQFYLAYPVYLCLVHRLFGVGRIRLAVALLFAASLLLCLAPQALTAMQVFYLLPFRAWEMAAGGLICLWPLKCGTNRGGMDWLSAAGFATILLSAAVIDPLQRWPSPVTLVPILGAAAVLVANSDMAKVGFYRWLHPIGLWSYSIYLWHWVILAYLRYRHPVLTVEDSLLGIALSCGAGAVSYHAIERPTQRLLRGCRFRTVLAGTALLGGLVYGGTLLPSWVLASFPEPYGAGPDVWRSYIEGKAGEDDKSAACAGIARNGELRRCVFTGPHAIGTNTLVIGDSHAGMWIPRFERLTRSSPDNGIGGISLVLHHGCPLIPGLDNGARPCARFNDKAFDLAERGAFDHVLLVSVWDYFPDRPGGLCAIGPAGCVHKNQRALFTEHFSAFADRVRRLADAGIKVSIVLPPPFSAHDVPVELARRRFLALDRAEVEQMPRREQERRREQTVQALEGLTAIPGVRLLDPFDILCDPDRCHVVDAGGHALYFDSNHWKAAFVSGTPFIDDALTW